MSLQFRSRIKPAIDYSNVLNSYGVCCGLTGATGSPKSFIECFNEGGHFVPVTNGEQQVTCPDVETRFGCCSSCSYVTPGELNLVPTTFDPETPYLSSGFRSNVSLCECNRLGGKWTEGTCPDTLSNIQGSSNYWKTYCVLNEKDVRIPKACCHLMFDTTTGWPTGVSCSNVCNPNECALKGTDVYPAVYNEQVTCADASCPSNQYRSLMINRSSNSDEVGSCYELEQINGEWEYNCGLTIRNNCNGYWVAPLDSDNAYCTSAYQPSNPVRSGTYYNPQVMGLTAFEALGLVPGMEYQGGIYIGIFKPGPLNGTSSSVRGNLTFDEPTSNTFSGDAVGGTYNQWAIIVDFVPYATSFLNDSENDVYTPTSLWDGYYNTRGNNDTFYGITTVLSNTLRTYPRQGFIDYYIPSVYELGFLAEYLHANNMTISGNMLSSSIFNSKYLLSSSNQSRINSQTFVYGQNFFSGSNQYKNLLINKRDLASVLFFRRIVLT